MTEKTGPKRTQEKREQDLKFIGEAILQGETQAAIAERLNLSQQQVSIDLLAVRERWISQDLDSTEESLLATELARLDLLTRELFAGWSRSILDNGIGDPRFLTSTVRVIEQRCKLLGINKPEKLAISTFTEKDISEAFSAAIDEASNTENQLN